MSDYLGHIVTRTLSPASCVRPQLLSIFEPPPVHSESKGPLDSTPEIAAEPVAGAPKVATPLMRPVVSPDRDDQPRYEPSSRSQHSARDDGVPMREGALVVQHPLPRPLLASTPATGDERLTRHVDQEASSSQLHPPQRFRAVPTAQSSPPITAAADAPARPERRIEVTRAEPEARQLSDLGTTEQTSEERAGALTLSPLTALGPTIDAAPVRPLAPAQPSVARPTPGVTPFAGPGQPQSESVQGPPIRPAISVADISPPYLSRAAADAPEPTILVTIGRVEVRATPPPAERPRLPAAAKPVSTLEEYLRQRSAGRSR